MVVNSFLVILGGGMGSLCRYLLTHYSERWLGNGFPWGTLGVNLGGCLLMGFLFSLTGKNQLNHQMRLFFMTGFLGGITTFSAFALETSVFLTGNETLTALTNIAVNNVGGLVFILLGIWLGQLI